MVRDVSSDQGTSVGLRYVKKTTATSYYRDYNGPYYPVLVMVFFWVVAVRF